MKVFAKLRGQKNERDQRKCREGEIFFKIERSKRSRRKGLAFQYQVCEGEKPLCKIKGAERNLVEEKCQSKSKDFFFCLNAKTF